MTVFLAIETSQRVGGVALRDARGERGGRGGVHVEMLSPKKRHDDDLLPAIDRLFARAQLKPRDLIGGAVGVSIGPGGFTGLRIAVSTAKMFAETLGVKLVAVPSAVVAAESYRGNGPIAVALASKRDTVWATRLVRANDRWVIEGTPGLVTASDLALESVAALIGDAHLPEELRTHCARFNVKIIEPVFDPRFCLYVAERMLDEGEIADPVTLLPLYPRQPEAVSIWEARFSQ